MMFAPSLSRMARLLLPQLGRFPLQASVLSRVLSDTEALSETLLSTPAWKTSAELAFGAPVG